MNLFFKAPKAPMSPPPPAASNKAKRTPQGWKTEPKSPTETYADKVKRSKKQLDVKFNLTPLGFTCKNQQERQRQTEWTQHLFEQMTLEMQHENPLTKCTTMRLIKGTLENFGMYINISDMEKNKDSIKPIIIKDQKAVDFIWELAQRNTKQMEETKKQWIPALQQAIKNEENPKNPSDWPDDTRALDKSLREVGIRIPVKDLIKVTPWNLDENTLKKPDLTEQLWKTILEYARPKEEAKLLTEWEKHTTIELQKYTTVCNKKDKALIVHLFQKHNLHRIIQMTMTSSKIQMVNIKD